MLQSHTHPQPQLPPSHPTPHLVAGEGHALHVLALHQQLLGARGGVDDVVLLHAGHEVAHEADVKGHVGDLLSQGLGARQAARRGGVGGER